MFLDRRCGECGLRLLTRLHDARYICDACWSALNQAPTTAPSTTTPVSAPATASTPLRATPLGIALASANGVGEDLCTKPAQTPRATSWTAPGSRTRSELWTLCCTRSSSRLPERVASNMPTRVTEAALRRDRLPGRPFAGDSEVGQLMESMQLIG